MAASELSVSKKAFTIAGILTIVHGLDELPSSVSSVACLWLLHPRLAKQESMYPIGAQTITAWNERIKEGRAGKSPKGLIAVSFDQRNHGSRKVDDLANQAWREGNPRHAQDMFSIYHGTASDTSLLLSYLPSYIFGTATPHRLTQHFVLGVSLGGHAAWHCILQDPRITSAVVVIGCPDYTRLMTDRAALSKLETWTSTSPPGSTFLGSDDFPRALIDAVAKYDPAGLLLPGISDGETPSPVALQRFKHLVQQHLGGKRILNLCGGVDKLVPYAAGEPFLKVLKKTIEEDPELGVEFEDVSFEGVGHAFSPQMAGKAAQWIGDVLAKGGEPVLVSKI
ncbi:hypothetical protein K432DRAFT_384272 [Lepidopterella palustris CBS 459.81]|uniref:Alpha/beta-hydrolase n=1 Tax=Lepidopterella palustris CBS 459.81 TaxID=1314670 RepID=A0A8E2E5Y0_9PEZI|nr:hypothetical protein K432DRAFT_384272 [Lepidopterella palustris CBS 459.81]